MTYILGISAYYHDSAATLLKNGEIIAAAQEERFTRKKHDSRFPRNAIQYCLVEENLKLTDIDQIVFYEKPLVKFERLLETYLAYAPRGIHSFIIAMPVWLKEKLYLKNSLKKELAALENTKIKHLPNLFFAEHHQSHAASAFYPSPYKKAVVLCLDGVGEWATTTAWIGENNTLKALWEIDFPHSLGLLYSAFTYYTGFKVNSGEYKLMGLAPYGEPNYTGLILDNILDLKDDGTFRLNMQYFNYCTGLTMTNKRFDKLFGGPPRHPESPIEQKHMDIAASIQKVTELVLIKLATTLRNETQVDNICLAGGVALNCVANGKLLRSGIFNNLWVQPAAGDAGGALGAALVGWYNGKGGKRTISSKDEMKGSYLGPCFNANQIKDTLDSKGAIYDVLEDQLLFPRLAEILDSKSVIGWFQGRMEFGPRALGARSIIADPRSAKMQSVMNLKIKYRESFRPFAPSVLFESVNDYFELDSASPYMMVVAPVNEDLRILMTPEQQKVCGLEKLNVPRSQLPAITHVDFSARIQTVHKDTNPRYYELIKHFKKRTGCGAVVNTSFNVRGEPIVCTPEDAYQCFMNTEMDYLVIENFLLSKTEQPKLNADNSPKKEFALD